MYNQRMFGSQESSPRVVCIFTPLCIPLVFKFQIIENESTSYVLKPLVEWVCTLLVKLHLDLVEII